MIDSMKLPRGTQLLTSARQVEAIASPLRVEIVEHLAQAEPSSVADLARLMGRPATALHYHVNLLHRAGILRVAGRRAAGKRSEALFEPAAKAFAVAARPGQEQSVSEALHTLGATLRLAQREAARAMRRARVCGRGPGRNLHSRRLRARLPAATLRRVNRLLDELESIFRGAVKKDLGRGRRAAGMQRSAVEVMSLTFVLTPAGRPASGQAKKPAAKSARRR